MKRPSVSMELYNRVCDLADRIDPDRRAGFPSAVRALADYVDERLTEEFTADLREQIEEENQDRDPLGPGRRVGGDGFHDHEPGIPGVPGDDESGTIPGVLDPEEDDGGPL